MALKQIKDDDLSCNFVHNRMDNSPILLAIDQRGDNADNERDRRKYNNKMKWDSTNLNSEDRDPFFLFFNFKIHRSVCSWIGSARQWIFGL